MIPVVDHPFSSFSNGHGEMPHFQQKKSHQSVHPTNIVCKCHGWHPARHGDFDQSWDVLAIQKNFGWRFGVAIAATARVFSIIFYPLTTINHPFLGNWNFEPFPPPPTPPVQSPWSHRIARFASHGLRCYSSSLLDFLSSAAMKNPPRFLGKIGTKTERK